MKFWMLNLLFVFWVVFLTIANILANGTVGLVVIPFMAVFAGWQVGVLVGRLKG